MSFLSVQLSIPLVAALSRLRAEAFAADRTIIEVARAVLSGQLHLPADTAASDDA